MKALIQHCEVTRNMNLFSALKSGHRRAFCSSPSPFGQRSGSVQIRSSLMIGRIGMLVPGVWFIETTAPCMVAAKSAPLSYFPHHNRRSTCQLVGIETWDIEQFPFHGSSLADILERVQALARSLGAIAWSDRIEDAFSRYVVIACRVQPGEVWRTSPHALFQVILRRVGTCAVAKVPPG